MSVIDPWVDRQELENDDEGMDDDALSRLGLNVEPISHEVLNRMPLATSISQDQLAFDGSVQTTGITNLNDVTINGALNFGSVDINNLDVQDSITVNGIDLMGRIDIMETRINILEAVVLNLTQQINDM